MEKAYILTPKALEEYILSTITNGNPIRFYLPNAPVEVQNEYVKLNKLAHLICKIEDNDRRKFMLSQYQQRILNYQLMTKESCYGTLDDLLKE